MCAASAFSSVVVLIHITLYQYQAIRHAVALADGSLHGVHLCDNLAGAVSWSREDATSSLSPRPSPGVSCFQKKNTLRALALGKPAIK